MALTTLFFDDIPEIGLMITRRRFIVFFNGNPPLPKNPSPKTLLLLLREGAEVFVVFSPCPTVVDYGLTIAHMKSTVMVIACFDWLCPSADTLS